MENTDQDFLTELDITIDSDVRQQLYEAGKWTRFISIVMFVICGLLLLIGVFGGAVFLSAFRSLGGRYGFLGDFGGVALILAATVIAAALAVVYYFLFNFSQKIKTALLTENTADLNTGLKSLKIFFIITTSIAIISLLNTVVRLIF
jgi:hypothetical protein